MGNVAIVVLSHFDDKLKMLMVEQRTNNPNCSKCLIKKCSAHIKYTVPAGKIEINEDLKTATLREFRQETGHDFPEYESIRHFYECDTIITIVYTKQHIKEEFVNTDEIKSSKWVDIDDIKKLRTRNIFSKLYTKYFPIWDSYRKQTILKNE